jgi:hypothetical protein
VRRDFRGGKSRDVVRECRSDHIAGAVSTTDGTRRKRRQVVKEYRDATGSEASAYAGDLFPARPCAAGPGRDLPACSDHSPFDAGVAGPGRSSIGSPLQATSERAAYCIVKLAADDNPPDERAPLCAGFLGRLLGVVLSHRVRCLDQMEGMVRYVELEFTLHGFVPATEAAEQNMSGRFTCRVAAHRRSSPSVP